MGNEWLDSDFDADEEASDTLDALVDLNHPALRDVLVEVVNHPSQGLRFDAALRLAEMFQDVRALPALAEALNTHDRALQKAAAAAIWEIGDADATAVIDYLNDAQSAVRDKIGEALDQVGWQPDDVEHEVAYRIAVKMWRECVALGEVAVPGLLRALYDYDGNTRRAAAWALGQIRDERAVPDLIRLLADTAGDMFGPGDRVCDVAARALTLIGCLEALEAVAQWKSC